MARRHRALCGLCLQDRLMTNDQIMAVLVFIAGHKRLTITGVCTQCTAKLAKMMRFEEGE
jgi:hypothetical protein